LFNPTLEELLAPLKDWQLKMMEDSHRDAYEQYLKHPANLTVPLRPNSTLDFFRLHVLSMKSDTLQHRLTRAWIDEELQKMTVSTALDNLLNAVQTQLPQQQQTQQPQQGQDATEHGSQAGDDESES
jgi:hypothetical protein